ncbi:MAG TPA: hypothetical protein VFD32_15355 [Dehalococcoidia bacterium]|nr:hypothetical protein [Dehalococcoidia bacterium]
METPICPVYPSFPFPLPHPWWYAPVYPQPLVVQPGPLAVPPGMKVVPN